LNTGGTRRPGSRGKLLSPPGDQPQVLLVVVKVVRRSAYQFRITGFSFRLRGLSNPKPATQNW